MRVSVWVVVFVVTAFASAFAQNPNVPPNGAVNGATFVAPTDQPPAPGSIISIFGTNFALPSPATPTNSMAGGIPLPTSLGGVSVTVNDVPVPQIVFVQGVAANGDAQAQINAQMPWETATEGGMATIRITRDDVSSTQQIPVAAASPGIFTFQFGSGLGAVTNIRFPGFPDVDVVADSITQPTGSVCPALGIPPEQCTVTDQPAPVGGIISIFANGLGRVDGPVTTGDSASPNPGDPILNAEGEVRVFIGGQPAQVLFAGLHPTLVGLNQINAIVPNIEPGDAVPIVIEVVLDGVIFRSREDVTIAVRAAGEPVPN